MPGLPGSPARAPEPAAAPVVARLLSSFRLYGEISRQLSTVNVQSCATDARLVIPQSKVATLPKSIGAIRADVRSVLLQFFVQRGMESTVAERIASKSTGFINLLVSKLRTTCKSQKKKVKEVSNLEIRSTLLPYLSELSVKHAQKDVFSVVESNSPSPPAAESGALSSSLALVIMTNIGQVSPELTHYLRDLSMGLDDIDSILCNFPAFASYDVDRKVKPFVERLLELGMPRYCIPRIIRMKPGLCRFTLPDHIEHTLEYLESIGVNKARWGKVVCRSPRFLLLSRRQVEAVVSFIFELRVVKKDIGKIMFRAPNMFLCTVDGKLKPTADYFRSIGVDLASIMQNAPQTFVLNIEGKLKPIIHFFLDNGFSIEDIALMVNRFGSILGLSLTDNLLPKYNFYQTMDYPRHDLVKFPQYFGYSLERRIKRRNTLVAEHGMKLSLRLLLASTDSYFEQIEERCKRMPIKTKMSRFKLALVFICDLANSSLYLCTVHLS